MPAELGWLVTERILYSRSWGDLTLETITNNADAVMELLGSGHTNDVHIILDTLDIESFDVDLKRLNLQTRRYLTHPRMKCSVDVTKNARNRLMGHIVSDIANVSWTTVESLKQALDYLKLMDDDLQSIDTKLFDLFTPLKTFD